MRHAFEALVAGTVLTAGCVKDHARYQSPLVGEWQLASFVLPDSGGTAHPWWDDKPAGFIVYTDEGFMSAQLYDTRRPSLGVRWDSASADAARAQFAGLTTYYGTYVLDTLAHQSRTPSKERWPPTGLAASWSGAIGSYRRTKLNCVLSQMRMGAPLQSAPF